MVRIFFIIFLLAIGLISCKTDSTKTGDTFEIPDSLFEEEPLVIAEEAMDEIIQNVSSPVEMAALIKNTNAPFEQKYLCSPDLTDNINTNFKRALCLGILGADLGYLNMYNKTGSVVSYLSAIKKLSEDLKVGQFFDFTTLKRLATNNTNLDSLMYISVSSFNRMDDFLRENSRSNISTLIITGVWIEGLYLATQVVKEYHNKDIAERIGEQKIILGDLTIILKNYKSDPNFSVLIEKIEKIKNEYEGITIRYELDEPESIEEEGVLKIIQHETSYVDINNEQLNNIIKTAEEIRNFIINI
ncbi:MAG: hypothetical protein HY738_15465 [Bacteroidia bacterium]|nr:hypothetical protein [Bacteroidia bacterium]